MLRKIVVSAAVAAGLLAVPALPSQAAPSGGCPYPPHRPQLALSATPATTVAGQTTFVFGSFKQNNCGIHNGQIHVQSRPVVDGQATGSWATFAVPTTDSNGLWATHFAPKHDVLVRAFFWQSGVYPTTYSPSALVNVSDHLSLTAGRTTLCTVKVSGQTSPVKANRRIFVQNRGPKGQFNGWTTLWETRTNANGAYSSTHTLPCGSTYNLATYIAHDATNTAGRSHTVYGIKTPLVAQGF